MPAMGSTPVDRAGTVAVFATGQSLLVVPTAPCGIPAVPLFPGAVSFQGFPALAEEAVGGALRLKASKAAAR